MWNRSPANTKFDSCDITRTNCSVACAVKPDFLEISAFQQNQMDSLGGLNTLWMNMSLQQPAMRSRRGWNKVLCDKDGAQRTTASTHCRAVQQKNTRSSVPCPSKNGYKSPYTFICKTKATILVCLCLHNVSFRAAHLLSHDFSSVVTLQGK